MSFPPHTLFVDVRPPGNSRVAPAAASVTAPGERPAAAQDVLAGLPERRRVATDENFDNDSDIDVGSSADELVMPVAPQMTEDRIQLILPLVFDEQLRQRQVSFDDVRSRMADLNIVMMDPELLAIFACLRNRYMQVTAVHTRLRRSTNASDLLTQLNLQPPGRIFSVAALRALTPGRGGDIHRSIRQMHWCGTLRRRGRFGFHERTDVHIPVVDFFRNLDAHRDALRTRSGILGVPLRNSLR